MTIITVTKDFSERVNSYLGDILSVERTIVLECLWFWDFYPSRAYMKLFKHPWSKYNNK